MIRSIIIAAIFMGGGFFLSKFLIGYPRAGKDYISKQRETRKSLRHGSGLYIIGGRGFRGGK